MFSFADPQIAMDMKAGLILSGIIRTAMKKATGGMSWHSRTLTVLESDPESTRLHCLQIVRTSSLPLIVASSIQ